MSDSSSDNLSALTREQLVDRKGARLASASNMLAEQHFLERRGNGHQSAARIRQLKRQRTYILTVEVPEINEAIHRVSQESQDWKQHERKDFFEHFYRVASKLLPKETVEVISAAARQAVTNMESGTAQRLTGQVLPALGAVGGSKRRKKA